MNAIFAPLAALAALAPGLQEAPAPKPPQEDASAGAPRDALVLYSAGLDALMSDPRDAGLRTALGLLDDRLVELPGELGADPMPGQVLRLLFDVLGQPMMLRAGVPEGADWSMGPEFHADLRVGGGAPRVASIARRFSELVAKAMGVRADPVEAHPGLERMPTPAGPFVFGKQESRRGAEFVASFGQMRDPANLPRHDLPEGVEPLLAFELDLGPIEEMIRGVAANDPAVAVQLQIFGLLGAEPLSVTGAYGVQNGVGVFSSRAVNAAGGFGSAGAGDTLTARDLAVVPTDAVSASVVKANPADFLALLNLFSDDPDVDPIEMIHAFTGVHLRTDVVDHLGTTMGFFTSDTTGGGGLFSLVAFVEVTNEEKLSGTLGFVFDTVDDLVGLETDGRVDFRHWESRGVSGTSLTFPGWPIPLELSLTVSDGYLFFALSPQSLVAAVHQARSEGPGLLGNEEFRSGLRYGAEGLVSASFVDTARRIEEGWGLSTLLFSALANGMRSPADETRDTYVILPPYHELVDAARPSVSYGRIEGSDVVLRGTCDPSVTAQVASLCGSPAMPLIGSVGLAAGFAVPFMMIANSPPEPYVFEVEDYDAEDEEDF